MTVFVPTTVTDAQALRAAGEARDLVGYADGAGLRRWLGAGQLDDEEASYVALNHAGVASLLLSDTGRRLVLAVDLEVPGDDDLGTVPVPRLGWAEVQSLFADDASAVEQVVAARQAVAGLDLAEALAVTEVEALQEAHDLLWYAPDELDTLADPA